MEMSCVQSLCKPVAFLKTVIPSVFLLSLVPHSFLVWLAWRILTLFLPPWVYQKGEDFIFGAYQLAILFFFEHVLGTETTIYGDAEEALKKKERVLYIANHQSDVDFIIVHMLAARQGSLNQVRYVLKDAIQLVPMFGQYLYQHGCIYVNRGNFNQGKMTRALKYLQSPNIDSWMVVFPEGTRYNPNAGKLIERSRQHAESQGITPMEHLLTPRSRAVFLCLSELKSHFDAVYDVTVIYEGTKDEKTGRRLRTPNMFEFLRLTKPKLHIHLNRINIQTAPQTEPEIKDWLNKIYSHKDRLVDAYYGRQADSTNGVNSLSWGHGTSSSLSKLKTVPVILVHFSLLLPFLFFDSGSNLYWRTFLYGTIGSYVWLAIRSVA